MFDTRNVSAYLRGLIRSLLADLLPHPSTIQLLYRVDVYTPEGKLVKTTGDRKSHSFVLQFLQMMELHMAHAYVVNPNSVAVTNTAGTPVAWVVHASQQVNTVLATEAASADADYGILVGTGSTPPANTDYNLETKIAHGSAATQLQYGTTSIAGAAVVGANVDMVITRTFINSSGSSITINEIGLAVKEMWAASVAHYFLIVHDAVSQAVANTYIAIVSYTFRTTV